ncbi:MAG: di-trans,poly-cis-decaprenylcistransferase [Gammaproteobacteria bacterium]|nr:MAG: di-trans,poly-cis-decaprenylcistransferase [Gammaproteobacteria bacterium]
MDGNGRWAQQRGQPRHLGHRAGVDSVRRTIEACVEHGIEFLTLFAFSSENWRRPRSEVDMLMELFMVALAREIRKLDKNDIRLRVIGDVSAFPEKLQKQIAEAEQRTADNSGLLLQIAANYGGRWDITQAARRLAEEAVAGRLDPKDIDEACFARMTSFGEVPDPDLFIRTGGELRISNFLLWHCAYSELYFTPTLWPDFDKAAFVEALREYARRERRFGQISEQLDDRAGLG